MLTKVQNLYHFVDQTVDQIYKQHQEAICCKPGCADCCHAVFDISFIEAVGIGLFLFENRKIVTSQQEHAKRAAQEIEQLAATGEEPSKARIRCPLLGNDDLCLAHDVRPINCRTYGTPTVINGKAHVCGLSGFDSNIEYPTIDLAPLQNSLNQYSVELGGEEIGNRRFPMAWVFLRLDYFLPPALRDQYQNE